MKKLILSLCLLVVVVLCATTPVQALITEYGFSSILPNWSDDNVAIGEDQLFFVVSDEPVTPVYDGDTLTGFVATPEDDSLDGDILFTFYNTGDEECSIVDIYCYDGTLLVKSDGSSTISIVGSSDGVLYSVGADPWQLPGLENLKLVDAYSVVGSADSDPDQIIENGINPDEWLSISFELQTDEYGDPLTIYDVITALGTADGDEGDSLFIGLRVHFLNPDDDTIWDIDGEEQFLNNPVPIPAPSAVFLGGIGIVLVGWLRRRRTL